MAARREIKVFIASPNDLAIERRAFKERVDSLNKGFGRGAGVEFISLGWEDVISQVGRRSQSVINQDVDACDIFILAMWRRWGQKAPDAAPYTSYTEEEFYRAFARLEKTGSPHICVFFKDIDPAQMADAGPQLRKVLKFRRNLEAAKNVNYQPFGDENVFSKKIEAHLCNLATLPLNTAPLPDGQAIVPDSIKAKLERDRQNFERMVAELEQMKVGAHRAINDAAQARAEAKDAITKAAAAEQAANANAAARTLDLAEFAAKAALDGRIEEARQAFAKALDGTANLRVLFLGYEFFERVGDLDEAERLLHSWLAISGRNEPTVNTAAALGNLGLIAQTRGQLDEAEKLLRESLEIYRNLGQLEGQASGLGNLALCMRLRGDLDAAEALFCESLETNRRLGRQAGQAIQLSNLGMLALARGNFEAAEKLINEASELERKIGRLEGQANALGGLGLIAQSRGDLDKAEQLLRQGLEIDCRLGRLDGQATALANLGVIAHMRGDIGLAEKLHNESLEIERRLGRPEGQATQLCNLGLFAQTRGDLDSAEMLLCEAMRIDRSINRPEGLANNLANLGIVAAQRGNSSEARRLWVESRDLYSRIGIQQKILLLQGWLDGLPADE